MSRNTLWIAANFSDQTGYAWTNIYRLFAVLAKRLSDCNVGVCVSFAKIDGKGLCVDGQTHAPAFVFDPLDLRLSRLIHVRKDIVRYNIRYVYFTDLPTYHPFYLLLRCWGVEKIIVHDRVSVPDPRPEPQVVGMKKRLKCLAGRLGVISADRAYVVSDFVRTRLINKNCFPESKIVKILNGVDVAKFSCVGPTQNEVVRLFVGGRATRDKGVHVLIEACHLLRVDLLITDFRVDYAGDGPDRQEFQDLAARLSLLDVFRFHGEVHSTVELVCAADIVVVPSVWGDACPSAVSEAMAAGKAVVTTMAGGIPEIVGDPANARLVEPGDARALAVALADLIKAPETRAELGRRARERAEAALTEAVYHDAVLAQILRDLNLSQSG